MGGSITVIVRKKNGEIIKSCRWTNSLPAFVSNIKFIEQDEEYLEKYLKPYYEMKADWEKNKDTGNFEHNMTDCYAPNNGTLAPDGYGIVIFDYMTNHVIHLQGYCDLGSTDNLIALEAFAKEKDRSYFSDEVDQFTDLWNAKKVTAYKFWDKTGEKLIEIKDIKHLKKLAKRERFGKFLFDMAPWTIIKYHEDCGGVDELKAKVLELGFELTEEENKNWDEFKERYKDEDDE